MSEIVLSAHRLSWATPVQHGTVWDKSRVLEKVRDKILSRDNHTCQGCGWRALNFQEIHHKDHDHSNFRESNLETLCPLCHQVFHPASAHISGGAEMIWLPEISQVDLNRLLFPVFAILRTGMSHPLYNVAKAVDGLLGMRKQYLLSQMGKSDPGVFGQMLLNMSAADYENRSAMLAPIKMLANANRFEMEIDYWRACLEQEKSPQEWVHWGQELQTLTLSSP